MGSGVLGSGDGGLGLRVAVVSLCLEMEHREVTSLCIHCCRGNRPSVRPSDLQPPRCFRDAIQDTMSRTRQKDRPQNVLCPRLHLPQVSGLFRKVGRCPTGRSCLACRVAGVTGTHPGPAVPLPS